MTAARRTGIVTGLIASMVVLSAGSALAYWKTTGSGSGSRTTASTWTENVGLTTLSIDTISANSNHSINLAGKAAKGTAGDGSVTLVLCKVNTWPCPTNAPTSVLQTITITQAAINGTTGAWSTTSNNVNNGTTVYARATQTRTAGTLTSNIAGPVIA
ncbi:MAG: hypothetical protein JWP14_3357 [Frankiales bacterium]|nr:hypothetical protein [Frankiales bacterium]